MTFTAFPAAIWILVAVAAVLSAVGFYKFIYFISIGYGFAISGCGAAMLVICRNSLSFGTTVLCILFIVYGLRLGGYLLIRELKSAAYRKTLEHETKESDSMSLGGKFAIWVSCAVLYVAQVSPVFYRLANGFKTDAITVIGAIVMLGGLILEAASDLQKTALKKKNPHRFCDTGLFRIVRCPNYFGEVLIWTGVFLSGVTALRTTGQWIIALIGYLGIVYIMFSGARRLELRQNKNYGADPEYQAYVKKTPILLPFVPLYSVAKYKFLVG